LRVKCCYNKVIPSKQKLLSLCYKIKKMNYWLLKTDPDTYNWDNLVSKGSDMWDGVRNYQARNNLREIKKGDTIFIYHSGNEPGIIGLAEAIKEYYPDPTADNGDWSVIEIKPVRKLKRYITLEEIKQKPELGNMYLVRNTRLSVQPVTLKEYNFILKLEKAG
jgi:predicted RNA-binding protein with PUA-like domain